MHFNVYTPEAIDIHRTHPACPNVYGISDSIPAISKHTEFSVAAATADEKDARVLCADAPRIVASKRDSRGVWR